MKQITISKVDAFRVAATLADATSYEPQYRSIVLEAGGRMIASNGFALLISDDAHDAAETTYLTFRKPPRIRKSTTLITIENNILTEEAGATSKHHTVQTSTQGVHYSPDAVLTSVSDSELKTPEAPYDSIKGGKLASAYGLESPRGAWLPTCNSSIVHLGDTRAGDLVLLATLHQDSAPVNRFPLNNALSKQAPAFTATAHQ